MLPSRFTHNIQLSRFSVLIWLALLVPLVAYGVPTLRRNSRTNINNRPLFQGITYRRRVKTQPLPQIVHILEIDLTAPGLTPLATGGFDGGTPNANELNTRETIALRTAQFLKANDLQVAINGNYFYPFQETTPWNYGPKSGQPASLVGVAISEGELVSSAEKGWPALCFLPQQAVIQKDGSCPEETTQALGGDALLLESGEPVDVLAVVLAGNQLDKAYPMNIAALDESGTRLWLILSDGKQPLYSEGTRLTDIYALLQDLGATTALRLDGGGSTTLVIESEGRPRILNAVIHAKIPGFERPVGNHLGFYATPLSP